MHKKYAKGRIICVFGCGGNRDTEKREVMGEISGRLADFTVITTDNPRNEDPKKIMGQIEQGVKSTRKSYDVAKSEFENVVFRYFGGTSVSHKAGDAFSYLSRAGYYTSPLQARECTAQVEVLELYETEHTYRMQFILTAGAHSSDVYTAVFVKRDDGSCYWKALR